jgi:transposase InsO family protein
MHQYNVRASFERKAIDVAGPFPQSAQGNQYLLIAVDYFTKWPEALVTSFFCCFRVPQELHSDQGCNFESRLIEEVLQCLRVNMLCTTPLHPQSDGMVERYIRTIQEHIRKVIALHQKDWDSRLSIFLLAYRASTYDTMGLIPASQVFGREL